MQLIPCRTHALSASHVAQLSQLESGGPGYLVCFQSCFGGLKTNILPAPGVGSLSGLA